MTVRIYDGVRIIKIVSACLVGCKCRYDNESALHSEVENLVRNCQAVPVCPEQLGGCGNHGFDVRNDVEVSRVIINKILDFFMEIASLNPS
jgi:uncharacterized protein YbbK (DUF523 family)